MAPQAVALAPLFGPYTGLTPPTGGLHLLPPGVAPRPGLPLLATYQPVAALHVMSFGLAEDTASRQVSTAAELAGWLAGHGSGTLADCATDDVLVYMAD
ncbi:hypothetical protein GPECTOR_9g437 [Gonium pectorale]|uniref:Uncharacterized protein n=1 Tax=Gonium pectorale TaxID=33097 RepID=A0A150GRI1_GONPE|nr:hypothetical protein GPECTOR_9g437 [Gonium pectorale]|eukprot:KXZ52393.1 hypothetical protein GPECTOR_9g437 [Gonium pectorale]